MTPHKYDAADVFHDLLGWIEEGCPLSRLRQPWLSREFLHRNKTHQPAPDNDQIRQTGEVIYERNE